MTSVVTMRRSTAFIVLSLGFIVGIFIGSVWSIKEHWLFAAMAFFVAGFGFSYSDPGSSIPTYVGVRYGAGTNPPVGGTNEHANDTKKIPTLYIYVRYIMLCLVFLSFGVWRIQTVKSVPNEYTSIFDTKIDTEGVIVEEPDVRTDKQLLTVRLDGYHQNTLITITKTNSYFYGDKVWIRGKIVEPKSFDDFDYRGYLERFNVYALMRYPKVITLRQGQGNIVKEKLLRIKALAVKRIAGILDEPYSSLLLGIIIGAKKTLPKEILDAFNSTGTSHIVAVSGFNISVIVGALGYLAHLFGRRSSMWLSLIIIAVFVVMAGASSSVLRAGFMGILLLLSFNIGRLYAITPSFLCSAFLMLVINPRILYWDGSFQLSFAATAGIIYGMPVLQKLFARVPKDFGIKDTLLVTLSANFATLPIILLMFSRLSVISPLVNVIVLPFVPLTMLLGALILLPFIGVGFGFVTLWLLKLMLFIIQWFAQLPFASISWNISNQVFWELTAGIICIFVLLNVLGRHFSPSTEADRLVDQEGGRVI